MATAKLRNSTVKKIFFHAFAVNLKTAFTAIQSRLSVGKASVTLISMCLRN